MIKTNELRIGNLVAMPSSGETTIITAMDISDIQSNLKNRLGIALTTDWLLRFGFEKKPLLHMEWRDYYVKEFNFTWYGFILGEPEYELTNPNIGIMVLHHPFEKDITCPTDEDINNKMDWPESNHHFAWGISFVHQLQNLYHALTGEELTLKPRDNRLIA